MKRVLPVDIEGLNLILGGGVPVLKRYPDLGESAALLLRGPPGSGKTILGLQLAGSLGRTLGCDVAYGCIELLPSELEAQHAGIKPDGIAERVVVPEFPEEVPSTSECRIFAATLDIKSTGNQPAEVAQLVPAVEHLLAGVEKSGGRPHILVIDSLSDGYHLGASAPRILADDLCKMAVQRGLVLILLEEITDSRPSAWSFATDLVIDLGAPHAEATLSASDPFERRLRVVKNRFGPSDPADHRFAIFTRFGVRVLPHPRAYLSKWAPEVVLAGYELSVTDQQRWFPGLNVPQDWPAFRDCVTGINSSRSTDESYSTVMKCGTTTHDDKSFGGNDLILDFESLNRSMHFSEMSTAATYYFIPCGDPFLSGDWLLSTAIAELEDLFRRGQFVRRVLIGHLEAIQNTLNPDGIWHALAILASILRRAHIPAILFGWHLGGRVHLRVMSLLDVHVNVSDANQPTIRLDLHERRSGQYIRTQLSR